MKTLFCDLDNTLLFQLENGTYGIKDNMHSGVVQSEVTLDDLFAC